MQRFYDRIEQIEESGKVSTYAVDEQSGEKYRLTIEMVPCSTASGSGEISAGIRTSADTIQFRGGFNSAEEVARYLLTVSKTLQRMDWLNESIHSPLRKR